MLFTFLAFNRQCFPEQLTTKRAGRGFVCNVGHMTVGTEAACSDETCDFCVMWSSAGVNNKFHHNRVLNWFFWRCDICCVTKSATVWFSFDLIQCLRWVSDDIVSYAHFTQSITKEAATPLFFEMENKATIVHCYYTLSLLVFASSHERPNFSISFMTAPHQVFFALPLFLFSIEDYLSF